MYVRQRDWPEAPPRQCLGDRDIGTAQHRREEVNSGVDQFVRLAGFDRAFATDDQRHAGGFLVEHRLLIEPVRPGAFAMVAGEDDDGVVLLAGFP
jgi:hypothetical protein